MSNEGRPYGLVVEFATSEELVAAAGEAREAGYRKFDAFSPFPVKGLGAVADRRRLVLPLLALAGALAGGGLIYFVQIYMNAIDYPLNVGGRPLHSWPTYLPITALVGILTAAVAVTLGMLALNRLPQFYHPMFNVPEFAGATQDTFFLCITGDDAAFSVVETRRFLEGLRPRSVSEVPW